MNLHGIHPRTIGLVVAALVCAGLLQAGIQTRTPRATFQGIAIMDENGKPLPKAHITLTPDDFLNGQQMEEITVRTDAQGRFKFRNIVAGQYTLNATARRHESTTVVLSIDEGVSKDYHIRMSPGAPALSMYVNQRNYTQDERPVLTLSGFIPKGKPHFTLYKLDLTQAKSPSELLRDQGLTSFPKVKEYDYDPKNMSPEGGFTDKVKLEPLKPGLYGIACSWGTINETATLNITRLALVTKRGRNSNLVYASDIVTGKSLPGVRISEPDGKKMLGETDANGLFAMKGGDGFFRGEWKGNVAWSGNRPFGDNEKDGNVAIYTERPIYTPGDTIQVKGVFRTGERMHQRPPAAGTTVELILKDGDENEIERQTTHLNTHGSFSAHFKTQPEQPPSVMTLAASGAGLSGTQLIPLAHYVKPQMKLSYTPETKDLYLGDRLKGKIHAEYYFGAPAPGVPLRIYVSRAKMYSFMDDTDENDGEEGSSYSEWSTYESGYDQHVDLTTDENGDVVLDTPTRPGEQNPSEWEEGSDYNYTIHVTAGPEDSPSVEESFEEKASQAAYRIQIQSDSYGAKNGDKFKVSIRAVDPKTRNPVAGRPVVLSLNKKTNQGNDPGYFQELSTLSGQTDSTGYAHFDVAMPDIKYLVLRASSPDGLGHTAQAASGVYRMDERYIYEDVDEESGAPSTTFKLHCDKKKFNPGDVAHLTISCSRPGGDALVTIEMDDILATKVVNLTGPTTRCDIQIPANAQPSATICASYVQNKKFLERHVAIKLLRLDQELKVSVKADRPAARPGEKVKFTIDTKDLRDKARSAEVSLGVVDESIYAIKEDDFDIMSELNPKPYEQVQTNYSFEEIYLDGGDKTPPDVDVRRNFQDTAFWAPVLQTDAKGHAEVTVKLPDNITSWRATAIAVTDDTLVGEGRTNVKARKELMARLATPPTMVAGDEGAVVLTLHNDTGKDDSINLEMSSTGAPLTEKDLRRTVAIPNGGQQSIEFHVEPKHAGPVVVTAKAWTSSGFTDGVEAHATVKAHSAPRLTSVGGQVKGAKSETFELASNADLYDGALEVQIMPSITAGLASAWHGMINYPYGCAEQISSQLTANVKVADTFRKNGMPLPYSEAEIKKMNTGGFARLKDLQMPGGGFRWWGSENHTDPMMTALVLDAMADAKDAGVPIQYIHTKSLVKAAHEIAIASSNPEEEVTLEYALAKWGAPVDKKKLNSIDWRKEAPEVWALAGLTYQKSGDRGKALGFLERIRSYIVRQGELSFLRGQGWMPKGALTSVALLAFVEIAPDDPEVTRMIRYLMTSIRTMDLWESTHATRRTIQALTSWLKRSHDLTQEGDVTVELNGKTVKGVHVMGSDRSRYTTVRIPVRQLQRGGNRVTLRASAGFEPYYTANLTQYPVEKSLDTPSGPKGLKITREYFQMVGERNPSGSENTYSLVAKPVDINALQRGMVIKCVLTIESGDEREFVMITDPTPSNMRAVDPSEARGWDYWYSGAAEYPDRMTFFARTCTATQKIEYYMRVERPGKGFALPPSFQPMYDPSFFGTGVENVLRSQG